MNPHGSAQPDPRGSRLGPFWLTPRISRGNAVSYFASAFMFVTLVTFVNFLQPYVLNDMLRVIGLLIWAVGFALFPTAQTLAKLYAYRFVIAVGTATASVMVIATI